MIKEPVMFDLQASSISHPAKSAGDERGFLNLAESLGEIFVLQEMEDDQFRILYVSRRCEEIWGVTSDQFCRNSRIWFDSIHSEDRARMSESVYSSRMLKGFDEEFRVVRPDGSVRWVRQRAQPVSGGEASVHRIAGIIEDVTERRSLERLLLELDDNERFRIGQDLHDGICQQLVGIAFATDTLRRSLETRTPDEAFRAAKIMALLDSAIFQARNLSQVLYPVNLAGAGLSVALRGLEETVAHVPGVSFFADCSDEVNVRSGSLAMHIYRIAQEAVQNALQHTCPGQITVRLSGSDHSLVLKITENGLLREERGEAEYENCLNAIRFRAQLAGGGLKVSGQPPGERVLTFSFENLTVEKPGKSGNPVAALHEEHLS
jgi:PAS domain S-box-containing protein